MSSGTLVDSNVLLDILTEDPTWRGWSSDALAQAAEAGPVYVNPDGSPAPVPRLRRSSNRGRGSPTSYGSGCTGTRTQQPRCRWSQYGPSPFIVPEGTIAQAAVEMERSVSARSAGSSASPPSMTCSCASPQSASTDCTARLARCYVGIRLCFGLAPSPMSPFSIANCTTTWRPGRGQTIVRGNRCLPGQWPHRMQ